MGFRKEIKFVIPRSVFEVLRESLAVYLEPDLHGDVFGYPVKSLYFDSLNNQDLFAVLDGHLSKGKVRLRTYSADSDIYHLELKQRKGNEVIKHSVDLNKSQAIEISKGNFTPLLAIDDPFSKSLYCKLKSDYYRPKVIVTYNRQAYIHVFNNIRITFDTNIRSSIDTSRYFSDDIQGLLGSSPMMGILEVKYDDFLLEPIKRCLSGISSSQIANSKYANVILKHSF